MISNNTDLSYIKKVNEIEAYTRLINEHKININDKNNLGKTALFYANLQAVKLLIEHNVDVNVRSKEGFNAIVDKMKHEVSSHKYTLNTELADYINLIFAKNINIEETLTQLDELVEMYHSNNPFSNRTEIEESLNILVYLNNENSQKLYKKNPEYFERQKHGIHSLTVSPTSFADLDKLKFLKSKGFDLNSETSIISQNPYLESVLYTIKNKDFNHSNKKITEDLIERFYNCDKLGFSKKEMKIKKEENFVILKYAIEHKNLPFNKKILSLLSKPEYVDWYMKNYNINKNDFTQDEKFQIIKDISNNNSLLRYYLKQGFYPKEHYVEKVIIKNTKNDFTYDYLYLTPLNHKDFNKRDKENILLLLEYTPDNSKIYFDKTSLFLNRLDMTIFSKKEIDFIFEKLEKPLMALNEEIKDNPSVLKKSIDSINVVKKLLNTDLDIFKHFSNNEILLNVNKKNAIKFYIEEMKLNPYNNENGIPVMEIFPLEKRTIFKELMAKKEKYELSKILNEDITFNKKVIKRL